MEPAMRLGSVLRERRQLLGLSLADVSQQTGIHRSVVWRIEEGQVERPAPDRLQRLAKALELPAADLFALVGYSLPATSLPPLRPYLRAKYGPLPETALADVEAYLQRIAQRYGEAGEPIDGEDEEPDNDN